MVRDQKKGKNDCWKLNSLWEIENAERGKDLLAVETILKEIYYLKNTWVTADAFIDIINKYVTAMRYGKYHHKCFS